MISTERLAIKKDNVQRQLSQVTEKISRLSAIQDQLSHQLKELETIQDLRHESEKEQKNQ